MEEQKIKDIENGTVIDHIPAGKAVKVLEALGQKKDIILAAINVSSTKMGQKDVLKFENRFLAADELKKIKPIAPAATINTIKGTKVVEKKKV